MWFQKFLSNRHWWAWGLLLSVWGWGIRCNHQLAGSSTNVDNPAISVSFIDSGGSAIVSGQALLFSLNQNPLTHPNPLATWQFNAQATLEISAKELDTIFSTQGMAKSGLSSVADTFNLVIITDDGRGALYANALNSEFEKDLSKPADTLNIELNARVQAQGYLKSTRSDFLYIPGSPFAAKIVGQQFLFDSIPEGLYPLITISDSLNLVQVKDSLSTTTPDTLILGSTVGRLDQNSIVYFPPSPYGDNLTLIAPNGGEDYWAGDMLEIIWRSNGLLDYTLRVELSTDGGTTWLPIQQQLSNVPSSAGVTDTALWQVPELFRNLALITQTAKIRCPNLVDESDQNFSFRGKKLQ